MATYQKRPQVKRFVRKSTYSGRDIRGTTVTRRDVTVAKRNRKARAMRPLKTLRKRG